MAHHTKNQHIITIDRHRTMKTIIITSVAFLSAISAAVASNNSFESASADHVASQGFSAESLTEQIHEQAAAAANEKLDRFLQLQSEYNFERIDSMIESDGEYATVSSAYAMVITASAE
jgi:hypothetical protein